MVSRLCSPSFRTIFGKFYIENKPFSKVKDCPASGNLQLEKKFQGNSGLDKLEGIKIEFSPESYWDLNLRLGKWFFRYIMN